MKLKTATLIALIGISIYIIVSAYFNISYWIDSTNWDEGYMSISGLFRSLLFMTKDILIALFFLIMYKNQR